MIHFTCCLVYFVVLHASVTAFLPGRMIPLIPAVASQRSIRSLIASRSAKPDGDNKNNAKGKFSLSNLVQLITMGAGAPMLGEYKETDENGRMIFELEANNYVDSDGKIIQTKAKYFTDGYVEDDFEVKPPGFFANLLSGGKLQAQWDEQFRSKGKD